MNDEDKALWVNRINEYRASSLTAVKWCEENKVSVHGLRHYISKFNKENKLQSIEETTKTKWASLDMPNIITEENSNKLKITIGQATIEVDANFNPDIFESVVRILSKC